MLIRYPRTVRASEKKFWQVMVQNQQTLVVVSVQINEKILDLIFIEKTVVGGNNPYLNTKI